MESKSIVRDLQQKILDNQLDVLVLLRQAHVIASKLNLTDFDTWVQCEMDGYKGKAPVPEYRVVYGECKALNPFKGWIPIIFSQDEIEKILSKQALPNSMAELILLTNGGEDIIIQFPNNIQKMIMVDDFICALHVTNASVKAIIEYVKNCLLEWTIKLEKANILGNNSIFESKEIEAAKTLPQIINYNYKINNTCNIGEFSITNVNGIDFEQLKTVIDKEIDNKIDKDKAMSMLDDISKEIKNNPKDGDNGKLFKPLVEFLTSVGSSIAVALIKAKLNL